MQHDGRNANKIFARKYQRKDPGGKRLRKLGKRPLKSGREQVNCIELAVDKVTVTSKKKQEISRPATSSAKENNVPQIINVSMDRGSNFDMVVHNFCLHHHVYKCNRCFHIVHTYSL